MIFSRIIQFILKSPHRKFQSFGFRWIRYLPGIPLPFRLSFGAWWLLQNDLISAALLANQFEETERAFVNRFLRPGMTVLDIGAHRGLYSLIFALKVGHEGHVFAFEPSPRERKGLKQHLLLNRCRNVTLFDFALGKSAGLADLFLVQGSETGCNSLRSPDVQQPTRVVPVCVRTLDDVLREQRIPPVDFIKLDVEGAELDVLKGAAQLLNSSNRPTILCEVQDQRTAPWGHSAACIIQHLCACSYSWFEIDEAGKLRPLALDKTYYDGNFVACPKESESMLDDLKA